MHCTCQHMCNRKEDTKQGSSFIKDKIYKTHSNGYQAYSLIENKPTTSRLEVY